MNCIYILPALSLSLLISSREASFKEGNIQEVVSTLEDFLGDSQVVSLVVFLVVNIRVDSLVGSILVASLVGSTLVGSTLADNTLEVNTQVVNILVSSPHSNLNIPHNSHPNSNLNILLNNHPHNNHLHNSPHEWSL
jgi:hypothetical protein